MMQWIARAAPMLVAGALAIAIGGSAAAQGVGSSPTTKFLKAVRDEDGTTVTTMLKAPGSTVVNTRDVGNRETALEIVINRQDNTWLSFLLAQKANPNLETSRGDPPMLLAVEQNFPEGVKTLLIGRANINAANRAGETALIRAVQRRNLAMVELLIENGADPDRRDVIAGRSARDYAKTDTRNPRILAAIEAGKAKPKPAAGPTL